jgi:D-alanine-D-alanine ligase
MNELEAAVPSSAGSGAGTPSLRDLRVAVIGGGASGEREVSLATARGVRGALNEALNDATKAPATERANEAAAPTTLEFAALRVLDVLAIELEVDGRWSFNGRTLDAAAALDALRDVDVFFLCLHGGAGEDGTLQGLLSASGRRHTGSGVRASALCMDKLALRGLARECGMRVAPGVCLSARGWRSERPAEFARALSISRSGWVVKPRCGGSSVDTAIVRDASALSPAIERVLAGGDDALVEARVEGVELSCGVLDGPAGSRALPPIEIQPRDGQFFDYEQKYSTQGAREVCPPENVDARSFRRVQALAERIHRSAGCRGYSRTDFIVPRSESNAGETWFGEPVLLEVNTLPGLTERSLLPQEAASVGIGYRELCLRILAAALGDPADSGPLRGAL